MGSQNKNRGNGAKRPCAYVKCKKLYPPSVDNQKFHVDECRVMAFYLRKIEGVEGEQVGWEREVRKIVARQELDG